MMAYFHFQVHLFHKFPLQAIPGAFSKFQSSARKFGDITATDQFITNQYLFLFIAQYTINPDIEPVHNRSEYFFLKEKPADE